MDFISAKNDEILRSRGKEIVDDEERYNQLKAIEPLVDKKYKNGEITKIKYEKFKKQLSEWG